MKKRMWIVSMIVIGLLLSAGFMQGQAAAASKSRLTIAWVESPFNGMNACMAKAGTDFGWNTLVYEPLWIPKFAGGYIPWLAKSWEFDSANNVWTVHLDERAKWSDGKPVTAEDVKFTFETAFKYKLYAGSGIQPFLKAIEAADAKTVKFVMKENFANFEWAVSAALIVPKHIFSTVGDVTKFTNPDPIGSGPFIQKEYKREKYLHAVKNPNYWKADIQIDEVLYKVMSNEEAKTMSLRKGDIDAIEEYRGTFSVIPALKKDKNIEVVISQAPFTTHLLPNNRIFPYGKKEVRQAISLAIDRKEIIEVAFEGYADPPLMGFVSPLYKKYANTDTLWPGMNMSAEQRYAKANAILDGLGFKKGSDGIRQTKDGKMKVDLIQMNQPAFIRTAEIMKENLKAIGIDATVQPKDPHTLYRGIVYNKDNSMNWQLMGPHNSTVKGLEYVCTEWAPESDIIWFNANANAWKDEATQSLLRKARREMNEDERVKLVKKAQEHFADQLGSIVLCHKNMIYTYRTDNLVGWDDTMVTYGGFYFPVASLPTLTSLRPAK